MRKIEIVDKDGRTCSALGAVVGTRIIEIIGGTLSKKSQANNKLDLKKQRMRCTDLNTIVASWTR